MSNLTQGGALSAEPCDRLTLLREIADLFASHKDASDLSEAISDSIAGLIPHEYASFMIYKPPGRLDGGVEVRLVIVDGQRHRELEQRPLVLGEIAKAAFSQNECLVYDIDALAQKNPNAHAMMAPHGVRSLCSLPLKTARGPLGVLTVGSRRDHAFGPAEVEVLQEISAQLAIGAENALAFEEIRRLRDALLSEKRYLEDELRERHDFRDIVGQSGTLRRALQQVDTVAATDATVLLTGETGTGKELVARAIHDRSPRRSHNFVRVNCAAIPATLIESEMFGHERGAFTGAVGARPGRFEVAHRGTLFLDEVGELPLEVQPKLLRAIQEHEIERLGSTSPTKVDVRLIAATNRDLADMVGEGKFRDDLFYRLNVFPIRLPPLRERKDDIPALVRHFVAKHAQRLKRSITAMPTETMEALRNWSWPGNIRELENVIERAAILATDGVLRVPFLQAAPAEPATGDAATPALNRLEEVERATILAALRASGGVVSGPSGAAARLGLRRTTLQSRMQRLGVRRGGY
jgi:formate hydrogenlyase transcriptional activator